MTRCLSYCVRSTERYHAGQAISGIDRYQGGNFQKVQLYLQLRWFFPVPLEKIASVSPVGNKNTSKPRSPRRRNKNTEGCWWIGKKRRDQKPLALGHDSIGGCARTRRKPADFEVAGDRFLLRVNGASDWLPVSEIIGAVNRRDGILSRGIRSGLDSCASKGFL